MKKMSTLERLASFPKLNPYPVLEVDSKGKVLFYNSASHKLIKGFKKGISAGVFLPADFTEIAKGLQGKKESCLARQVRIKNLTFLETIVVIPAMNRVRIYTSDITEQKKIEDDLKKARAELKIKVDQRTGELSKSNKELNREINERQRVEREIRFRNALLRLAGNANSRQEYLNTAIRLFQGWSGCRCAGIRLLNEGGNIPYESYSGFSREFWEKENCLSVKDDECACIRVVRGKFLPEEKSTLTKLGSFFCGNTTEFFSGTVKNQKDKFRGTCLKEGFRSVTILPIRDKAKIIGAIHLADERENLPDRERVELLESLALLVGEDLVKFNLRDSIRRSNELLEKVFSGTNFHIAYMDSNFNFIRVNRAYAQADGQQPDFFVGKNHFQLYPNEENRQIFKDVLNSGLPYTAFAKPFIYTGHPERGVTYWDWSLHPVKGPDGKVEGLVLFLVDVTKRKQAEEELTSAQKELTDAKRLSDIGTLAATVAHELRNPLAAIQLATYNIKRKAANPLLDKHLFNIEKKVSESGQIIDNLLFYSKLRPPKYEGVDIYDAVNDCLALVKKRRPGQKILIYRDISRIKKLRVEADPLQIKEVFNNILNNAYDALPESRSRIEVAAGIDHRILVIRIKDNGEGMDEETIQRACDPFFTTKARGTGLGLAVCKQILNFHKGEISISSTKGIGTTVTVTLPVKRESNANR